MSISFIDLLTLIFILLDNKIPDSFIINIIDIYTSLCEWNSCTSAWKSLKM